MRAYYNEIDPAAAHILRALIEEGVIANGDVDTRSIKEVEPHDLEGYTQCHFFAGGGLWSVAARLAGWPDDAPLWTGSCPCQPFSAAGKGLGADDPRHLWPDFHRLISACRPAVVMGEQVAGKAGYGWFDGVRADLAREDFTARAIDFPACSVDAPHQRNRLYWIAMDNARCYRERQSQSEICAGRHSTHHADASGVILGDTFGSRLERQCGHGDTSGRQEASGSIAATDGAAAAGHLANDQGGERRTRLCEAGTKRDGDFSPDCVGSRSLRRNGTYWSGSEWIACHDGKARRAQSGIRFLVDGLPGRVDLWRVGGNAIVPEAAAEVIAAFMDVYGVPVSTMRAAA